MALAAIQSSNRVHNNQAQNNTAQQNTTASQTNSNDATVKATSLQSNRVTIPENPQSGEKVETYLEIKKTQMQYQVASDMMNIASGSDKGITPVTAAYLSHNEDAWATALQHKTMQQQYENIQTYSDQQEKYQNSWVV